MTLIVHSLTAVALVLLCWNVWGLLKRGRSHPLLIGILLLVFGVEGGILWTLASHTCRR